MQQFEAGDVQVLPHVEQHEVEWPRQRLQRFETIALVELHAARESGARERLARVLDLEILEPERLPLAARGARGGWEPHSGIAVGAADLEDAARARARRE